MLLFCSVIMLHAWDEYKFVGLPSGKLLCSVRGWTKFLVQTKFFVSINAPRWILYPVNCVVRWTIFQFVGAIMELPCGKWSQTRKLYSRAVTKCHFQFSCSALHVVYWCFCFMRRSCAVEIGDLQNRIRQFEDNNWISELMWMYRNVFYRCSQSTKIV